MRLKTLVERVYAVGLFHLLLSILFVQGLTYYSQLLIAWLVGPGDFGIVRSIEALVGIAVVIGSAGMPTLAVCSIAGVDAPEIRSILLGRLVRVSIASSVLVALPVMLIGVQCVVQEGHTYLFAMIWIIGMTSASRTLINYFQGIKQFERMSIVNATLSCASLSILIGAVATLGMKGWMVGRYAGEFLFLVGALVLVRRSISFNGRLPESYSYMRLVSLGLSVAVSQAMRSTIDNMAIFTLGFLGEAPRVVGLYGLSGLIITGVSIVPGSIATLAIPRLVERLQRGSVEAWKLYRRITMWTLIISIGGCLVIVWIAPAIVALFGNDYRGAAPILVILSLSLPVRGISAQACAMLLAHGQIKLSLKGNFIVLMLGFMLLMKAIAVYGVTGAAWINVLIECLLMIVFLASVNRAALVK